MTREFSFGMSIMKASAPFLSRKGSRDDEIRALDMDVSTAKSNNLPSDETWRLLDSLS